MPADVRRIILLGSTGSIGRQTVEVIAHLNSLAERGGFDRRYEIVGLAAGKDADTLLAQAAALDVRQIALAEAPSQALDAARSRGLTLHTGPDAAESLVRAVGCDVVLGAIVGSAGLQATLAAVELGRDIALANKETLVAAGEIVVRAAAASGSALLPVDSEHSGVWQCLAGYGACFVGSPADRPFVPPCALNRSVRKLILTASGGALRSRPLAQLGSATPEDALAHPTWSMGAKVTIDSASLTNKALELIEAHWLFGVPAGRLEAVIHPQSIVHSIVEFEDGSCVAQLGSPDMRTPIQYALTYPTHVPGRAAGLDFRALSRLDFAPPDAERYPALAAGLRVIEQGGTSGAIFNAANEAAVSAFLARRVSFGRLAELSSAAIDHVGVSPIRDLSDVLSADREARRFVEASIAGVVAPRSSQARTAH